MTIHENFDSDRIQKAIERVANSKYAFGICSNADNKGNHVIFFDFDGDVTLKQVEESLKRTMLVYKLSGVYILKSDNGYNAFCLDMSDFDFVHSILCNTDFCCKDFIRIGYEKRKFYVLRMCYDKHYLEYIDGYVDNPYLKSDSHRWFFKEIMNFPIKENGKFDNNYLLKFIAYKSPKHGTVDLDE